MPSEPRGHGSGRRIVLLTDATPRGDDAAPPADQADSQAGWDVRGETACEQPGHRSAAEAVPADRPELGLVAGLDGMGGADDESWQERALCAQTDPESFFPEKGGSTREAKRICQSCEVRLQCLQYALEHDERFGIWGGLSERERRRLKKGIV